MPLLLMSPAFPPNGEIPKEYTCDGTDISPPLSWSGVPAGTASLVLVVEDQDAPRGAFHHWAAFDIPPAAPGLPGGYGPGHAVPGAHEARNDFGKPGYGGPCPPPGGGVHHYHFELMAISRPTLGPGSSVTAAEVITAAAPYVVARAELIGTDRR
jgi:Raf kinase inhibitor-like YbhB/YbcL family protein